ncbi:putative solute-binding protein, partial [Acinetobacter baumannii]|uniref:putative solute-binding protein n=1 Tax=Acinetobacter baumannii TaxID=470 RepID=UPI00294B20F9
MYQIIITKTYIPTIILQIPGKYKMNLSAEDKLKYQKMLRDGRMDLTKRGIYDAGMMSV